MIRALIADDEWAARAKLQMWLVEQGDIEVVAQCADGFDTLEAIGRLNPDLVFLDIQMSGQSGLEVAAQLEQAAAPLLVFVTAFNEHAIRAFELSAVDYLLKPYDKDRLLKTLARIRARTLDRTARSNVIATARAQTNSSERLLVPENGQLLLIDSASIEWIEADDNYVHVHTAQRSHLLRRTLQDLLSQLGERHFARIHRSTAVNVSAIAALVPLFKGDHEVRLRSGKTLRLSRRYKDALFDRMRR
jgi:two-component system, LytTR family, response regulator